MAKSDPTRQHIQNRQPDSTTRLLLPDSKGQRRAVPLYSPILTEPSAQLTDDELANLLEESPARIFLDASFLIGRSFDDSVWDAIFEHEVYITHWVWHELESWLENPSRNVWARDVLRSAKDIGSENIHFLPVPSGTRNIDPAIQHYLQILGLRKDAHSLGSVRLARELGRNPTESELNQYVQRLVQDRGYGIAIKGKRAAHRANLYSDELTLAEAVVSGLYDSAATMILTLDYDFFEQYYKLQYIINTHYRSLLIADAYIGQPLNFPERPLPAHQLFTEAFTSGKLVHLPVETDRLLLPQKQPPVPIEVVILGDSHPTMKFTGLEVFFGDDIRRLIETKIRTRGKNSEVLGDFNVHRCIHPDLQDVFGEFAVIAVDKETIGTGVTIVDAHLSLLRPERISKIEVTSLPESQKERGDIEQAASWANMRCSNRLTFEPAKSWINTSPRVISETLRFIPPWTLIFCDSSIFCRRLPEEIQEALLDVGAATTSSIAKAASTNAEPDTLGYRLQAGKFKTLHLHQNTPTDSPFRCARDEYLALLAHKKLLGTVEQSKLVQVLQRQPTETELRQHLQQFSQGRAVDRAIKGTYKDDPRLFFDDVLLVEAIMEGVIRGGDIIVLTSCRGTVEQFITLCTELARHYRAWRLLSNAMILGSELIDEHPSHAGFQGAVNEVVYRLSECNFHLPADSLDLQFQVWLLEHESPLKFFPVAFLAERPMQALLKEKSEAGGLLRANSPTTATLLWGPDPDELRGHLFFGDSAWTAIGSNSFPSDLRLDLTIDRVPSVDLVHSTNSSDALALPWHS